MPPHPVKVSGPGGCRGGGGPVPFFTQVPHPPPFCVKCICMGPFVPGSAVHAVVTSCLPKQLSMTSFYGSRGHRIGAFLHTAPESFYSSQDGMGMLRI